MEDLSIKLLFLRGFFFFLREAIGGGGRNKLFPCSSYHMVIEYMFSICQKKIDPFSAWLSLIWYYANNL